MNKLIKADIYHDGDFLVEDALISTFLPKENH